MEVKILGWCGAFPRPGAQTCSVMVRTERGTLLLDIGCGTLAQYLRFGNSAELQAVLLSHLHYDHMGDLGSLFYLINHDLRLGIREQRLPVYMPATPKPIHEVLCTPYCKPIAVEGSMEFCVGDIRVQTMLVKHTVECYAYRLEYAGKVLVYYTDTEYMPEGKDFIRGADLLICEATMSEGVLHSPGTGHMDDIQAGTTAREGGAKQLCLYHLPSDGDIPFMRERAAASYGSTVYTPDLKDTFIL